MTLHELLALASSLQLKPAPSGGGFVCLCPAHNDRNPSLSVGEGHDGRILIHCHAGCDLGAVLEGFGIAARDLFPKSLTREWSRLVPTSRYEPVEPVTGPVRTQVVEIASAADVSPTIVARYPYEDEQGELLYEVVRFHPKTFRQRRPDPDLPGRWTWSVKDVRKVLFRLPQVLAALSRNEPVFIVEGEKDVLAMEARGLCATTNSGGAGKFGPDHAAPFSGARSPILIVPDRDEAGMDHARKVERALRAVGAVHVRIVELPDRVSDNGRVPAKDVSDFFDAGGTPGELGAALFRPPGASESDPEAETGTEPPPEPETPPRPPPGPRRAPAPADPSLSDRAVAAGIEPGTTKSSQGAKLAALLAVLQPPDAARIHADLRGELIAIRADEEIGTSRKNELCAEATISALGRLGQFYHDPDKRTVRTCHFFDRCRKMLLPVRSDAFLTWLSIWTGINSGSATWRFVEGATHAHALSGPTTIPVVPDRYWTSRAVKPPNSYLRGGEGTQETQGTQGTGMTPSPISHLPSSISPGFARALGTVVYLSCGDGRMARIDAKGVRMVDNGTDGVLFAAGKTLAPWELTTPSDPFVTCALFSHLRAASMDAHVAVRLWMHAIPFQSRCRPPLLLTGDIGSGKTRTAIGMCELYGIPSRVQKVMKEGEEEFWTAVNAGGLFILDNADTHIPWLADTLATAATGGTSTRRVLYEDESVHDLRARSQIVITSANPTFAADAGLADRLAIARMAKSEERSQDEALSAEIALHRDASLSHIAITLSKALGDNSPPHEDAINSRFPDHSELAMKIGRALNIEAEAIKTVINSEMEKAILCVESDPILNTLDEFLKINGPFHGNARTLAGHLCILAPEIENSCTARKLAKRLKLNWNQICRYFLASFETDRDGFRVYHFARPGSSQ